jgi:hypothetical protein
MATTRALVAARKGDADAAASALAAAREIEDTQGFDTGTISRFEGEVALITGYFALSARVSEVSSAFDEAAGNSFYALGAAVNAIRARAADAGPLDIDFARRVQQRAASLGATRTAEQIGLIVAHAASMRNVTTQPPIPAAVTNDLPETGGLLGELAAMQRVRIGDLDEAQKALRTALQSWARLQHTAWRARCGFWLAEVTGDESYADDARDVLRRLKSPPGLEEMFRVQWRTAQAGRT